MIRLFLALAFCLWAPVAVLAQAPVWVQVEAQPSLEAAQERARDYASRLDNVVGYATGGRWFAVALGPYAPQDATTLLQRLRAQGQIPADSFIADGRRFQQQFWPVGTGAPTTAQPLPDATTLVAPQVTVAPQDPGSPSLATAVTQPAPAPQPADETLQQARASEALLDRDERSLLQTALQWAGFYNAAIDGAYGPGTRNAMADWQAANGFDVTGVLTTLQRQRLVADYNAVLDGMNLAVIRDETAGIEMIMPTGVVALAEYEPPFARYTATGDIGAQVLLISQQGDQDTLFGLYEIMQTLSIVPPEGARSRGDSSFELEGIDDLRHSYTYAELRDGVIKGFTLVWPARDEGRRIRILNQMKASFTPIPGVLDPGLVAPDDTQAIDLVSGLQVRQPQLSRSGFFIDGGGDVLTTSDVVRDCRRMTIDNVHDADVVHIDLPRGLAVLRPQAPLAPPAVARFQSGIPRLQAEIAVAGYPYGGILTTPSLTFGRLADIRGLQGEDELKRLTMITQVGDTGGPVLDTGGTVLGMLLPQRSQEGQFLPSDVQFSIDAAEIVQSLQTAGISVQSTDNSAALPAQTLAARGRDITVLVSCW